MIAPLGSWLWVIGETTAKLNSESESRKNYKSNFWAQGQARLQHVQIMQYCLKPYSLFTTAFIASSFLEY